MTTSTVANVRHKPLDTGSPTESHTDTDVVSERLPKRKSPTKASGPVPFAPIFYLETTISVVDDSVCLTFHGDGDSTSEIWMPLSCAGTAGMALLETAFGADAARRIARRVEG